MDEILKSFRKRNNLSQIKVAKKVGVAQSSYSAYESGKNEPSVPTLIKLADLYHVSVDELVGHAMPNMLNLNLLSEDEKKIIDKLQHLSAVNLAKLDGFAQAILDEQNRK